MSMLINTSITTLNAFSGKVEDWNLWSIKFIARATICGYKGVYMGTITVPPEADTTTDAPLLEAIKKTRWVIASF